MRNMVDRGDVVAKRMRPTIALAAIAIGAIGYAYHWRVKSVDDAKNYQLVFDLPDGWKKMPLTPGMAFIFQNKASHISMRGAVNNMVAEYNPTPDMDAQAIIGQYVTITEQNLTGWHYQMLQPVLAHGTEFKLIRRWTDTRCVVSAVAVQGNTTVIIALVGADKYKSHVDEGMDDFRNYLATLSLKPYQFPSES